MSRRISIQTALFACFSIFPLVGAQEEVDEELAALLKLPALMPINDLQDFLFYPNGSMVLCAGGDPGGSGQASLTLWNVKRQRQLHTLRGHKGPVHCVAQTLDGRYLASGGEDGQVIIWYSNSRAHYRRFTHLGPVLAVAFNKAGNHLASGDSKGNVFIWDLIGRRKSQALKTQDDAAVTIIRGRPVGNAYAYATSKGVIRIWDASLKREIATFNVPKPPVSSLEFSANGKQLLVGNANGTAFLWSVEKRDTWRRFRTGMRGPVLATFTKDNLYVATTGKKQTLMLWSISSRRALRKDIKLGQDPRILKYSPNGRTLAIGFENRIMLMPAPAIEVPTPLRNRILVWGAPKPHKLRGRWYVLIYKDTTPLGEEGNQAYPWHIYWAFREIPAPVDQGDRQGKGEKEDAFIRVRVWGKADVVQEDRRRQSRRGKKREDVIRFRKSGNCITAIAKVLQKKNGFKLVARRGAELRFDIDISTGKGKGRSASPMNVYIGAAAAHPNTMPFKFYAEKEPPPEEVLKLVEKAQKED